MISDSLAVKLAVLSLVIGACGYANSAAATEIPVTCTNSTSGARWQLNIDYGKRTVDSNSATIGPSEITWHDAKDAGNYTLDRATGNLTVILPSSTGGYFLYDHCQLKN